MAIVPQGSVWFGELWVVVVVVVKMGMDVMVPGGNCSLESFQFPTNDPQALHVATAVPWPAGADRHKGITHIDALRAVKVERKTTLPQALSS